MTEKKLEVYEEILLKGIGADSPHLAALTEARELLEKDGEELWPTPHFYACSKRLLSLCIPCSNWDVVARIITAGTARHPHHSWKWLSEWEYLPLRSLDNVREHSYGEPTGQFVLGTILGFFEGAAWLDQNWRAAANVYLNSMTILIRELLHAYWGDSWTRELTDPLLPDEKWEGRLTNAIYTWCKGGPEGHFRSSRMGELFAILDTGVAESHANQLEEQLPKWLLVVLDKLAYAALSTMRMSGRAYIVTLGIREVMKPLGQKT